MQLKLGIDAVENVVGASFCCFGVEKPTSAFAGGFVFVALFIMATVFLTVKRCRALDDFYGDES
jgi:hypothetical protein